MVNARKGRLHGRAARKVLDFDRVYAGIIAIGVAAFLFRTPDAPRAMALPWRRPTSRVAAPAAAGPRRPSRLRAMESKPKAKISLRNVTRTFAGSAGERIEALRDVSFDVEDLYGPGGRDIGEFRVLLGPSGCGKSTILRLIAGLDHPDSGEVLVSGRRSNARARPRHGLPSTRPFWLTVENIAYGLRINGTPAERDEIVARLKAVGLSGSKVYRKRSREACSSASPSRARSPCPRWS